MSRIFVVFKMTIFRTIFCHLKKVVKLSERRRRAKALAFVHVKSKLGADRRTGKLGADRRTGEQ